MTTYSETYPQADSVGRGMRNWRVRIFAITWLAYAGFYLCRKNFSVVIPLLTQELGWSKLQLANVVFGYSLLYSVGQFVSGSVADRFGARRVVGFGLLLSVLANLAMGMEVSLAFILAMACVNGAAQSTGWSGLVKTMSDWFNQSERGVVMAWWCTNYVLGGFAATLIASYAISQTWLLQSLTWQRGFIIPAFLLLIVAFCFVWLTRDRPADVNLEADEMGGAEVGSAVQQTSNDRVNAGTGGVWREVFSNRAVWMIALMYFFLKMTRYSFLFWLPLYLTERLHYDAGRAGYASSVYELVGFSGVLLAGYASDKLVQSRRFPVAAIMLGLLALFCLLQPVVADWGAVASITGIALIGVMTYGPDTLMSGAAAQDAVSPRATATAAGFINGVGSLGQLLSPYLVAFVAGRFGWDRLFSLFVVFALVGGGLLATMWNQPPRSLSLTQ